MTDPLPPQKGSDQNGVLAELFDAVEILVQRDRGRRRGRIGGELPREDHVVGGEGSSVMPLDAFLEVPYHPGAVPGDPAVLEARQLGGQERHEIAFWIEVGERLVEDPRAFRVLDADREVRVEDGRRLPVEQPQRAPAASPRRGRSRGPGLGQTRGGEQVGRDRRAEPEADHGLNEVPSAQPAYLYLAEQLPEGSQVLHCDVGHWQTMSPRLPAGPRPRKLQGMHYHVTGRGSGARQALRAWAFAT